MSQKFGLKAKTALTFDEFDNVIGQYARGAYQISFGGLDDTGKTRRKIMIVWFSLEEDRRRVRTLLMERSSPQPRAMAGPIPAPAGAG